MAKFVKEIYKARPWYHDFSKIGIQTKFNNYLYNFVLKLLRGEIDLAKNQRDKDTYILPYLTKAFQLNKPKDTTFLELFCADGYYSFWVKKYLNSFLSVGIDWNERDIKRCFLMKKILGFSGMKFIQKDILELSGSEQYDIVLNAGGLYHIAEPEKLIELCFKITKKYMILQTVTTLETEAEDYFVAPAPGWSHGCRFTDAWLVKKIKETGWDILDHDKHILSGNSRLCDKGSSYFLCKKQEYTERTS